MRRNKGFWLGIFLITLFLTGCGGDTVIVMQSSSGTKKSFEEKKEDTEKGNYVEEVLFDDIVRNPFVRLEKRQEAVIVKERESLENLVLSGVFYFPGKSYVIINGQIIKEKGFIDKKEVVIINKDNIVLRDSQGKEYLVELVSIRK